MKRIITLIICILIIGVSYYKHDFIIDKGLKYLNTTPKVKLLEKSIYYKDYGFNYVNNSSDFIPYNMQDLINIFYSAVNSRYEKFTFYCPKEYLDCLDDILYLSNDNNSDILTSIGNFVSPYNSFVSIEVSYDTIGESEITLNITYLYSQEEIDTINNKISEISKTIINDDMKKEDIIYAWHDYIINNTKYDEAYENELKECEGRKNCYPTHKSNKAIGPLFEGFGICSGYTDTMAIILDQLNIKNYKVASTTHVWNAVYLNDEWKHLDLTWDDPVSNKHDQDFLLHKFFLIDTKTLEEFDINDHLFDKSIYTELK